MRAILTPGPGEVEVADVAEPDPGSAVLVRARRVGICGTDTKIVSGKIPVSYPRILGHEMVGEVVDAPVGSSFASGDRVLVDPAVWCGRCVMCLEGRTNICLEGGLLGRDADGVFARMPRTRVRAVQSAVDVGGTTVSVELACDCRVSTSFVGARYLALDIADRAEPDPAPETETPEARDEREAAAVHTAEELLILQIERAAGQGLVELADPVPAGPAPTAPMAGEPPAVPSAQASAALTGQLLDWWSIDLVLWIATFLLALVLAASLRMRESAPLPGSRDAPSARSLLKRRDVAAFFLSTFLMIAAHASLYVFYSLYLAQIGYSNTVIGLMWSLGVAVASSLRAAPTLPSSWAMSRSPRGS